METKGGGCTEETICTGGTIGFRNNMARAEISPMMVLKAKALPTRLEKNQNVYQTIRSGMKLMSLTPGEKVLPCMMVHISGGQVPCNRAGRDDKGRNSPIPQGLGFNSQAVKASNRKEGWKNGLGNSRSGCSGRAKGLYIKVFTMSPYHVLHGQEGAIIINVMPFIFILHNRQGRR